MTSVGFQDHLRVIERQATLLADDAQAAGLQRKVPSAPHWTVGDLLIHVGTVHRWATAHVTGQRGDRPKQVAQEAAAAAPDELMYRLQWVRDGAADLVSALTVAPDDLQALVFLENAGPAREFWARRQAHDMAIHRVDALSARLGHLPTVAQVELSAPFAADGLDELLNGFLPRGSSALRSEESFLLTIAPSDVDRAWTVRISPDPPETVNHADPHANTVLTGTAAGLYLSLWNRADEISETGHEDVLGLWRDKVRIRWR